MAAGYWDVPRRPRPDRYLLLRQVEGGQVSYETKVVLVVVLWLAVAVAGIGLWWWRPWRRPAEAARLEADLDALDPAVTRILDFPGRERSDVPAPAGDANLPGPDAGAAPPGLRAGEPHHERMPRSLT